MMVLVTVSTELSTTVSYLMDLSSKKGRCPGEACAEITCTYGGQCLVDPVTGRGYCRCPENCPDVFAPVCGSDGVTYSNPCQLQLAACTQERWIITRKAEACMIVAVYACGVDVEKGPIRQQLWNAPPCDNVESWFGAQSRMIPGRFPGEACAEITCTYGGQCLVDPVTGRGYCRCPENCPDVFAPVCGSDGVTYSNPCQLQLAACTQERWIITRKAEACSKSLPPP
ncbi:AGRN [Cordylochernes scorpioides]|uniref:AGRN n=1 Tax=Cordylochernes scorpioides TaxID=51811 RepID=A0ABY6L9N9_9ARAC|nr:AGRN [Cordylochernes scorpioides]